MTEQAHGLDRNAFATDGREPNRQFSTAFFATIPDLGGNLEEAADDPAAGDDQLRHRVRRRAEHVRRARPRRHRKLHRHHGHKEPTWPLSTVHS
jgi:hypothetical protein